MKLTVAMLGLAVLAAPAAFADPGVAEGKALYEQRCVMCHGSGMANAPLIDKLNTLDNDVILAVLASPSPVPMMAAVTGGLSDEDKRNVAVFLSKKSLPASGNLPEVKAE
jgi:cytochrome c553